MPQSQKENNCTSKTERIFNIATFIMTKVVPILAVVLTIIYWAYAIYCYGQS